MLVKKYFTDRSNTLLPNIIKTDVLRDIESRLRRAQELKRAVIFGSQYNLESGLEYVDQTGRNRVVISKVVGVSENEALLHNDRKIPINMISKVMV